MKVSTVFDKIEKKINTEYPNFIKVILTETAFDSIASLRNLNLKSIQEIENFVNNKTDLLKNTNYVDEKGALKNFPFKFLIGHQTLLLNIPRDVDVFMNAKKTKKQNSPQDFDSVKLSVSLVEKIIKFGKNKNISFKFNFENIEDLLPENNRIRCVVKCPFCIVKIPCFFDTCWRIPNYYKHIVECAKKTTSSRSTTEPRIERAESASQVFAEVENAIR